MFAKLESTFTLILSKGWDFFRPRKKLGLVSIVVLSSIIISAWLIFTPTAHAGIGEDLMNFFASVLLALAGFFIKLTFFVLKFIIEVAGYNGFIDSPAVTVGWVMIRDMTNMFFVVVLLMIAFGTILGIEQYEYKHLLVKLLIAAVLVNFSRVICGLIIDIAQIVMVTFVNGIAATASGNLVNMFQVDQIFALAAGQGTTGSASVTFVAAVASITFSVIMLVTMLAFLFLIVARMAMLWVLIVLSPLAFVLNVLHQTEKYAHDWWHQFGSNVVSGPVIAFFLWLSFVTVGSGTIHDDIVKHNALQKDQLLQSGTAEEETVGITKIMSWDKMANFIIAIAMLLAGAKMAQELGVAGGSMMGSAGELGKKVAMYASGLQAARWTAGKVGEGAKAAGKFALMKAPIVGGDEWNRRGRRIKAAASKWYSKKWVEPRLYKAGENINKAYGKEKVKDLSKEHPEIQKLVALRNAAVASHDDSAIENYSKQLQDNGYEVDTDKNGKTELKKSFAGNTRALARMALWFAPAAFKEEYTKDAESGAEYAHEQLEHLVSTSKTPIGKFKTEAEARLHKLEETGSNIKKEKLETFYKKFNDASNEIAAELKVGKTPEELAKSGKFSRAQIFDQSRSKRALEAGEKADLTKHALHAEEERHRLETKEKLLQTGLGHTLEHKAAKEEAASKQLDEKLRAEKELEELKQIKKLLEGKGAKTQEIINFTKAQTANIKEDFDISKEEAEAEQRAKSFRKMGDDLRANQVLAEIQSKTAKRESDRVSAMSWEDKTFALKAMPLKIQQLEVDIAAASTANKPDEVKRLEQIKNKTIQRNMALQTALKSEGKEAAELGDSESLKTIGWTEVIDDTNRIRAELSKILGRVVMAGDETLAAKKVYDAFGGIEKAQGALTLYSNANKSAGMKGAGALFGLVGDRRTSSGQLERFFGQYDQATKTVNTGEINVGSGFYPTKIAEADHRKWITANGYAKINVENQIVGFDSKRAEQLAAIFQGKNDLFISQMQNGFFSSLNNADVNSTNKAEYENLLNEISKVLTDKNAKDRFDARASELLDKIKNLP